MISYSKKNKILVTGGSGRFGKILIRKNLKNFIFPTKKQLDITQISSIEKYIRKMKPVKIIHLAGLSRPLSIHDKQPEKSILLNIIGTSNLAIICKKYNIKLIFFSTNYVYPGVKGDYKETDALLPNSNYAWSKLGGEASVHMLKNSLILRVCMTEKPFLHKSAFSNVKSNFIFHENFAKIFLKIINKKGIINVGGKSQTIFQFAKKYKSDIKKIKSRGEFPLKMDMSLKKLKKYL